MAVLAEYGNQALSAGRALDTHVLASSIAAIDGLDAGILQEQLGATGPTFLVRHAEEIDHCFSQPTVEDISRCVAEVSLANAKEAAHWSHRAKRELSLASPTSL